MRGMIVSLGVALSFGVGCGSGSEFGSGPRIRPGLSPAVLGNLVLDTNASPAQGCSTGIAPCQWVLTIHSVGTDTLVINRVCIEGNTRGAFSIEGPEGLNEPDTDGSLAVAEQTDALLRITYDHDDLDPARNIDNIAVVIQSDAKDFPTLVVPVCGRMLDANDPPPDPVECTTPVPAPAEGERDDTLCPS